MRLDAGRRCGSTEGLATARPVAEEGTFGASAVQSNALHRMRKRHVIDEQMQQTLLREVDYDEAALGASNAV